MSFLGCYALPHLNRPISEDLKIQCLENSTLRYIFAGFSYKKTREQRMNAGRFATEGILGERMQRVNKFSH